MKKLIASELRYRRLFEATQDGILILDAKTGMIEDVNPSLIKMLGYSHEEFRKKKLWEVGAFKDIEASQAAFEALQENEYIRYEDLPLKTKDGRLIQVEFVSNVYLVGDEKVIQCDIRDITEHRQIITALQGNEKKYHDLINQSPDGYFIVELSGNILTVNKAMCKELEFSEEEFLSMSIWDIIPEKFLDHYRERLTRILQGESLKEAAEYEVRGKNGNIHYVEVLSAPRYSGKDIIGFQGVARDVTLRKRAEEALRESEEHYRLQVDALPDGVIVHSQGRIIFANRASATILGAASPADLTGKLVIEFVHPDYREVALKSIQPFVNENHPIPVEEQKFVRLDGTLIDVEVSVIPFAYTDKPAWLIVFNDITERKQGEEALRASEAKFRSYNENAPLGVFIVDQSGRYVEANAAATRMLGYTESELLHLSIPDVLAPQLLQAGLQQFQRVIQDGFASTEILFRRKDGTQFWATVLAVRLNEDRFMSYCQDITEHKQAEQALQEEQRLLSEAQRIGHIGSWSYDILTDTLQYSDEMYRLLDTSPQEFQHNRAGFLSLIYASDLLMVTKWMEDIKAGRQVKELDFRLFRKNGELRYIQSRGAVLFDPLGNPARFIGTAQDVSERKLAEIQIRQQIQRLTALSKIDQAIISSVNLGTMMEAVLSQVVAQLQVDAADVLLLNSDSQLLEYLTGSGFRTQARESARVPVGTSLAGRVAKERRLLKIDDLKDQPDDPFVSELLAKEGFVSYIGVPLITKGKVKGVLEVFHRTPLNPYAEWIDFLNSLAGQAAIAIENASLVANLERSNREISQAYDSTIEGWSRALDLRDKETEGHTLRVTELTLTLAQNFSFTDTQMLYIRWGALLHDIGKMGVPDNILLKPDTLSEEEGAIMRKHPQHAYDLLQPIAFLASALDIPYCHHEKWDGTGYPRGLKGEEIPLQARIFAVVDLWDALRSDRPYRAAWPEEKVREHILLSSGTHFDPQVVGVFMRFLNLK